MLEELTKINQSVANLLLHGLSPLLITQLPYDSISSQIKMFGDCEVLTELPLYMQAHFLRSKADYELCQRMDINPSIIHSLCMHGVYVKDSTKLQYLWDREVDGELLCEALMRINVYNHISAVQRNVALYGAPVSHSCVHLNVWSHISWDDVGLCMLDSNIYLQKLAQFLCEHADTSVMLDSYSVCCVSDPQKVLLDLIKLWFSCSKDIARFSEIVQRFSELFLLEYVCDDSPINYVTERFSWCKEFIDCIDIRKLPCDLRELVVFAFLNNKAAFLRFLMRMPGLLQKLSGSIIAERWFREYMDLNDVAEATYEQLLELPSKNIYEVSTPIHVDSFLAQVY